MKLSNVADWPVLNWNIFCPPLNVIFKEQNARIEKNDQKRRLVCRRFTSTYIYSDWS